MSITPAAISSAMSIGSYSIRARIARYVVVAHGGFLGIGEDRVAFPLERFWMRGDRLVIRGVTENDIEAMDDYRDQVRNYQRVADTGRVDLRLWNDAGIGG